MIRNKGVRFLSVALFVGATLSMFMACGSKTKDKATNTGSLLDKAQCVDLADTLSVDTISFGRVRTGDVVSRTFALSNSSESPVVVISTNTACGCLELTYPKEPVKSGERAEATMKFISSGYNYFYPRTFYINTTVSRLPKKIVVTADME